MKSVTITEIWYYWNYNDVGLLGDKIAPLFPKTESGLTKN